MTKATHEGLVWYNGKQPGDPEKLSRVVVDIAHGEGVAAGRQVPVSLPLGSDAWAGIDGEVGRERKILDDWKEVIESTDLLKGQ